MASPEPHTKLCTACCEVFPTTFFNRESASPDGLRYLCRACESEDRAERRKRRREQPEDEDPEPPRKRKPQEQYLYIMAISDDPNGEYYGFKIGRAADVDARAASLGASLPIEVVEYARFANAGHLERSLHRRFREHRVQARNSREWFKVPYADILRAIAELQS